MEKERLKRIEPDAFIEQYIIKRTGEIFFVRNVISYLETSLENTAKHECMHTVAVFKIKLKSQNKEEIWLSLLK